MATINTAHRFIAISAMILMFISSPSWAGMKEATQAYQRGDYATAAKEFRPLAEEDDADAQLDLSELYFTGKGVPQDYVLAHIWANLAAIKGLPGAIKQRDGVASKMTAQQIVEARMYAREWRPGALINHEFQQRMDGVRPDERWYLDYGRLKRIKNFVIRNVHLRGTAESNNLDVKTLREFLENRYKRHFASIPYEEIPIGKWNETNGRIYCNVWTVGINSPIAYYIDVHATTSGEIPELWDGQSLGLTTKEALEERVKTELGDMLEEFAFKFFEVRNSPKDAAGEAVLKRVMEMSEKYKREKAVRK